MLEAMAQVDTLASLEVTQFYDTTLVGAEERYSLRFTTLPDQRESADLPASASLHEIAGLLELELLFEIPSEGPPDYMPHALVAVLAGGDPEATFRSLRGFQVPSLAADQIEVDPELLAFAEYCTFEPLIPIEESAIRKAALAALITASGGVAAVAAPAAGPIILAYFGGSILVGGASAIAVTVADRWVDRKFGKG